MFVFDADLRTVSATVRDISAGIRAAQVEEQHAFVPVAARERRLEQVHRLLVAARREGMVGP